VRAQLTDFAKSQCAIKTLARLILAPTQGDLAAAVNATFIDLTPQSERWLASSWPSLSGGDSRKLQAAQLLCFGGNATITIRNGNSVSRYQVTGTQDSRQWNSHGLSFTLVGFRLSSADTPIRIFLRSRTLPELQAAEVIRDEFQGRLGMPVSVVIRTDPFFWMFNGPKNDIFELGATKAATPKDVIEQAYLTCPPRGTKEVCRVVTTGTAHR
jgi:hypothetical protein